MPTTAIKVAILELYPTSKGKALHPGAEHAKAALLSKNPHGNPSTPVGAAANAASTTLPARLRRGQGPPTISSHHVSTNAANRIATCTAGSIPTVKSRSMAARPGYAEVVTRALHGGCGGSDTSASTSVPLPPLGSKGVCDGESDARAGLFLPSSAVKASAASLAAALAPENAESEQSSRASNASTNERFFSAEVQTNCPTNTKPTKQAGGSRMYENVALTMSVDLVSAAQVGKPGWLAKQGYRCIVIPGGSAEKQYMCLKTAGAESLREFVASGGGYVGICAGAYLALSSWKPKRSLALLRGTALSEWERGQRRVRVKFTSLGQRQLRQTCANVHNLCHEHADDPNLRAQVSHSNSFSSSSSCMSDIDSTSGDASNRSTDSSATGVRAAVNTDLIVRYNQGPCILLPQSSHTLESPADCYTTARSDIGANSNNDEGHKNSSILPISESCEDDSHYYPPPGFPTALAIYAEGVDDVVDEAVTNEKLNVAQEKVSSRIADDDASRPRPVIASPRTASSTHSSPSGGTAAAVSGMCGAGRVVLLSPHFESTSTVAGSLDRSWNISSMDSQCQGVVRAAVTWAARADLQSGLG